VDAPLPRHDQATEQLARVLQLAGRNGCGCHEQAALFRLVSEHMFGTHCSILPYVRRDASRQH